VKQSDASLLGGRSVIGVTHLPEDFNEERQGSWTSLNLHPGDGIISIRIGLDGSRLELLQGLTEDNERLARTSNRLDLPSGSERYELGAWEVVA